MIKRIVWAVFLTLGVLALMTTPSYADQIYVCNGCVAPAGGDPNPVNPASINVGLAGSATDVAPLLIIVGVPNAGAAPTISLGSLSAAAGSAYYGLNNATSGGLTGVLEGQLTSSSSDACVTSGLTSGSGCSSESFVNWDTFDTSQKINDGGTFNLYAYAIDVALSSSSGGNSPINIDFSGSTVGSYVIGYGCKVALATCSPNGNVGDTPFTNAGFITGGSPTPPPVPEPASLMLLGSGLLALSSKRIFRKA